MTDTTRSTVAQDSEPTGPLATVRLLQLPVPIYARAQQHGDELIREFTLMAADLADRERLGDHIANRPLPARLTAIVETLGASYSGFTGEQEARLAAAVTNGEFVLGELTYRVPESVAAAAKALRDMLDEADEYCRAGQHLLTLATPPDLVAFRRWFLDEFDRQIAGQPPIAWPDYPDAPVRNDAG